MMSPSWPRSAAALAALLVLAVAANPVRRSSDIEARRRSAIDRNMIRFGRSYPAEPSAADIREAYQRSARRGNSFLRLGRSQPLTFTTDDLITLLRAYDDDEPAKRATNFVRLGRDPKFVRFGRSADDEKVLEQSSELVVSGYPQRKGRARDHFVRLGRDSEEIEEEEEERKKRSACVDCQS